MLKNQTLKLYKIGILGDGYSQKDPFTVKLLTNQIVQSCPPNCGTDFSSKQVDVNGQKIKLQVWSTIDLNYIPRYISTMKIFEKLDGYVFIYEIGSTQSFKSLNLMDKLSFMSKDAAKLLIGYQSKQTPRQISTQMGMQFAKQNNMMFLEMSYNQTQLSMLKALGKFAYDNKHAAQRKQLAKIQPYKNMDKHGCVQEILRLTDLIQFITNNQSC